VNENWSEYFKKRGKSVLIDNEVIYGSLLFTTTTAYNHLQDLERRRALLESQQLSNESASSVLTHAVHSDAYRAYVVNHTIALVGMGKNDRTSIYWDEKYNKDPRLKNFYDTRKSDIEYLKGLRNKVYAHADLDIPESIDLSRVYKLVKDILILVPDILGIQNPKIKPK